MPATWCHRLDDYLADGLTEPERVAFAAHLPDCPACRQAVAEHARLTELLSRAAACEPVPPELLGRVEGRLRAARRQRIVRRLSGLAAAAVLAVAGVLLARRPPPLPVLPRPSEHKTPGPSIVKAPAPRPAVRVVFREPSDVIAVPIKSTNPNVTIIWIYPAVKTARRPAAAPAQPSTPSGRRAS